MIGNSFFIAYNVNNRRRIDQSCVSCEDDRTSAICGEHILVFSTVGRQNSLHRHRNIDLNYVTGLPFFFHRIISRIGDRGSAVKANGCAVSPSGNTERKSKLFAPLKSQSDFYLSVFRIIGALGYGKRLTTRSGGFHLSRFVEIYNYAIFVFKKRKSRYDSRARRADTSATAVKRSVGKDVIASHLSASAVCNKRAVAVKRHDLRKIRLTRMLTAKRPFGVKGAEVCIIEALVYCIGKHIVSRKLKESLGKAHPRHGHAGFLHDPLVIGLGLLYRGMIEKLMSATAATDNAELTIDYTVTEIQAGCFVFFNARYSIILQKPLEAGHHLIGFDYRIFVRREGVFISDINEVSVVDKSG